MLGHGWIDERFLQRCVLLMLRLEVVKPCVEAVVRRSGERPDEVGSLALHFPTWIEPFRLGAPDGDVAAKRQQCGCDSNIGLSEHICAPFAALLRRVLAHHERAQANDLLLVIVRGIEPVLACTAEDFDGLIRMHPLAVHHPCGRILPLLIELVRVLPCISADMVGSFSVKELMNGQRDRVWVVCLATATAKDERDKNKKGSDRRTRSHACL